MSRVKKAILKHGSTFRCVLFWGYSYRDNISKVISYKDLSTVVSAKMQFKRGSSDSIELELSLHDGINILDASQGKFEIQISTARGYELKEGIITGDIIFTFDDETTINLFDLRLEIQGSITS
jgi:hypothetical protein